MYALPRLTSPALALSIATALCTGSSPAAQATPDGTSLVPPGERANLAGENSLLRFTNVAPALGLEQTSQLVESVAWGDYDNDGDEDLYLTGPGPNTLHRNEGNGTFTDVSGPTGTAHPGFSVGTAFGDLDNDGDLDLYVVTFMAGPDVLYRNDGPVGPGGEFQFTDVAASAGITNEDSSRGMAFVDYDRDGLLDIYVNSIGPNLLYHNLGTMQFADVASALGVDADDQGVGTVATDVDNNGWMDVFTGNRSNDLNRLYLNTSASFGDVTVPAGILSTGLGMGVLSFDYDNDSDMDLYWTTWPGSGANPTPNALYENVGTGFIDRATASGTTDPLGWGISCNAGDIDNDGWQDFFITNGFDPGSTANVLFHNQRNGRFKEVVRPLRGGTLFDGRGVAFADYDNDGDTDLFVTAGVGSANRLWRNDSVSNNHWIQLRLRGTSGNLSAIGARARVTTGGTVQLQEVSGGAGRGSFNSLPLEFGLGAATAVDTIELRWTDGSVQVLQDVAVDQVLTIDQP